MPLKLSKFNWNWNLNEICVVRTYDLWASRSGHLISKSRESRVQTPVDRFFIIRFQLISTVEINVILILETITELNDNYNPPLEWLVFLFSVTLVKD